MNQRTPLTLALFLLASVSSLAPVVVQNKSPKDSPVAANADPFSVVIATLVPATITAAPQANPSLQITEPSAGSIVNPGQTLIVKVNSPTPALFPEVALIGDPFGFAGTISPLPGELSMQIPMDIDLGSHTLTVEGTPKSGKEPVSATVEIDVERPDFPASMSANFPGIQFDSPGEQIRLEVLAQFFDRTTVPIKTSTHSITESSRISFSSANRDVATVDSSGQVTAVAPGSGLITVKYTLGDNKLSIGIPVQVPNRDSEPGASNFVFSISPGMQTIQPGDSASFKITASTYNGFTGEIELSARGLPEGATAEFTPVAIHASESATMTIATSRSTSFDTYPIFITGRSGKLNPTASVLLIVTTNRKR
jgi:hypothetical protein